MAFASTFALDTGLGLLIAGLVLVMPGWPLARWLRAEGQLAAPLVGVIPALGIASMTVSGSLLYWLVPLTRVTCLAHAIAVVVGASWLARRSERRMHGPATANEVKPNNRGRGSLLWVSCFGAGALACTDAIPRVIDGGLYAAPALHDHARIVFVDALSRTGLPPHNPLYSPGETMPLGYYYLWPLGAAMVKVVTGTSGWPADIALSWWSATATLGVAASLAVAIGGRVRAGFGALVLGLMGAAYLGLPMAVRVALPWLSPSDPGGFRPLLEQGRWAPHHVLAGATLALLLWLLRKPARGPASVAILAVLAAFAAASSGWVALGLVLTGPLVLAVLLKYLGREISLPLVLASLGALLLTLPSLLTVMAPPCGHAGSPLALAILQVSSQTGSPWLQLPLYWIHFLPAVLAPSLIAGLIGLVSVQPGDLSLRAFRALSWVSVLGVLLACQLIASVIANNDFAWRANLLPQVLLVIWGGAALAHVRPSEHPLRALALLAPLGLGVAGARYGPPPIEPDPERVAHHRDFLAQERAFTIAREHTGRSARVLSNPQGFSDILPWPINLDYLLFANRDTVFAHPHWVYTYCPGDSPQRMAQLGSLVQSVFSPSPPRAALDALRDVLHVEIIVVHREDPSFASEAYTQTGAYRLIHAEEQFKLYRAEPK